MTICLNFGRLAPPGRGLRWGDFFLLRLTAASAQCLRLSERFLHTVWFPSSPTSNIFSPLSFEQQANDSATFSYIQTRMITGLKIVQSQYCQSHDSQRRRMIAKKVLSGARVHPTTRQRH